MMEAWPVSVYLPLVHYCLLPTQPQSRDGPTLGRDGEDPRPRTELVFPSIVSNLRVLWEEARGWEGKPSRLTDLMGAKSVSVGPPSPTLTMAA